MANKTCGECKHYGTPKNCICIFAEETYPAVEKGCKDFEPKPKPTNGDRIRQLSNEELIPYLDCTACIYSGYSCAVTDCDCAEGKLAWLSAPVEGEGK